MTRPRLRRHVSPCSPRAPTSCSRCPCSTAWWRSRMAAPGKADAGARLDGYQGGGHPPPFPHEKVVGATGRTGIQRLDHDAVRPHRRAQVFRHESHGRAASDQQQLGDRLGAEYRLERLQRQFGKSGYRPGNRFRWKDQHGLRPVCAGDAEAAVAMGIDDLAVGGDARQQIHGGREQGDGRWAAGADGASVSDAFCRRSHFSPVSSTSGAAMKIDDEVPTTMPNSMPMAKTSTASPPMKASGIMARKVVTDVKIVRESVSLMLRSISSRRGMVLYLRRFSRIRS